MTHKVLNDSIYFYLPIKKPPKIKETIKYVYILFDYSIDISIYYFQDSILSFMFEDEFNSDVYSSNPTTKLKELFFGDKFNKPIDNLPYGIKKIIFGKLFDQRVDNLPNSVEVIKFGHYFDQPVDFLPYRLKHLIFDNNFNHPIDNLPPTIETLNMGFWFNQEIRILPKNIKNLTFHRMDNNKQLDKLLDFYYS